MSARVWHVHTAAPLRGLGEELGEVTAPDKDTAFRLARWIHGERVVVMPKVGAASEMPEVAPPPRQKRDPPVWHVMTPLEKEMALALGVCRFPGPCFSKRFAGTLWGRAKFDPAPKISERETAMLRQLVHTYRRQIRAEIIHAAEITSEATNGSA